MRTDLPDQFSLSGIDPATGEPASVLTVGLGTGTLAVTVSSALISAPPVTYALLLEDGASALLLESGTEKLLLEA